MIDSALKLAKSITVAVHLFEPERAKKIPVRCYENGTGTEFTIRSVEMQDGLLCLNIDKRHNNELTPDHHEATDYA